MSEGLVSVVVVSVDGDGDAQETSLPQNVPKCQKNPLFISPKSSPKFLFLTDFPFWGR